jgi:hypothetical protein
VVLLPRRPPVSDGTIPQPGGFQASGAYRGMPPRCSASPVS